MATTVSVPKRELPIQEIKWYDAWIRWEKGSKEVYNNNDESGDDDNEEDEQPPVPTDTYYYEHGNIQLQIDGFPSDSEVIWTSTGLTIWRSSSYLCDWLVENLLPLSKSQQNQHQAPQDNSSNNNNNGNLRVLELGSGLGRCGILAAHLLASSSSPASSSSDGNNSDSSNNINDDDACCYRRRHRRHEVVLTDGDTDTLSQLRANVKQNLNNVKNVTVSCHQLVWGKETSKKFLQQHFAANGKQQKFDLIIGSDLLYVPNVIDELFETVVELLSSNNNNNSESSKFIMAHCARRHGNKVTLDMILTAATKVGLSYTLLLDDPDIVDDIYLYSFQHRNQNHRQQQPNEDE